MQTTGTGSKERVLARLGLSRPQEPPGLMKPEEVSSALMLGISVGDRYEAIVNDQTLPYESRASAYWNEIIASPDEFAIGVGAIIHNLPFIGTSSETQNQKDAKRLIEETLEARIPRFFRSIAKDRVFEYYKGLFPILIHYLNQGDHAIPKSADQFLMPFVNGHFEEDEQLYLVTEALNMQLASNSYSINNPSVLTGLPAKAAEKDVFSQASYALERAKISEGFSQLMGGLLQKAHTFESDVLVTALILTNAKEGVMMNFAQFGGIEASVKTLGIGYVMGFIDRFYKQEGGHLEAIRIITKALENKPPAIKILISSFLAEKVLVHAGREGNTQALSPRTNFAPFLHRLLAEAKDPQNHEAKEILYALVAQTNFKRPIVSDDLLIDNHLVAGVTALKSFSDEERLMVAAYYIRSLAHFGMVVDVNLLSDEALLKIAEGEWKIYSDELTTGTRLTILDTGQVVGRYEKPKKPHLGKLNGHNNGHAQAAQDTIKVINPIAVQTNDIHIKEGVPLTSPEIPESGIVYTSDAYPIEDMGIEKAFSKEPSDLDKILNNSTQEGRIAATIINHLGWFFSEEKMIALEETRTKLWGELEGPGSIRGTTFTPARSWLRLTEGKTSVAGIDIFPRVEFHHQTQTWDKGVYLSDIAGTLVFAPDLTISFSLDKNGYLHGDIDSLANRDLLPLGPYIALNKRVVELAHKALVMNREAFASRAYEAAIRTLGGSVKTSAEISKKRVEEQLAGSERYLKPTVETRLPDGKVVGVVEIDREKIYEELARDPEKTIHVTHHLQSEIKQAINKGKNYESNEEQEAQWQKRGGRIVLLRHGHRPSPEGIRKSEVLKQHIVEHHVFECDENGLPHEMIFYTTPRLWLENQADPFDT